jgi:hypothetical protein
MKTEINPKDIVETIGVKLQEDGSLISRNNPDNTPMIELCMIFKKHATSDMEEHYLNDLTALLVKETEKRIDNANLKFLGFRQEIESPKNRMTLYVACEGKLLEQVRKYENLQEEEKIPAEEIGELYLLPL